MIRPDTSRSVCSASSSAALAPERCVVRFTRGCRGYGPRWCLEAEAARRRLAHPSTDRLDWDRSGVGEPGRGHITRPASAPVGRGNCQAVRLTDRTEGAVVALAPDLRHILGEDGMQVRLLHRVAMGEAEADPAELVETMDGRRQAHRDARLIAEPGVEKRRERERARRVVVAGQDLDLELGVPLDDPRRHVDDRLAGAQEDLLMPSVDLQRVLVPRRDVVVVVGMKRVAADDEKRLLSRRPVDHGAEDRLEGLDGDLEVPSSSASFPQISKPKCGSDQGYRAMSSLESTLGAFRGRAPGVKSLKASFRSATSFTGSTIVFDETALCVDLCGSPRDACPLEAQRPARASAPGAPRRRSCGASQTCG
jgi:hypothetical protein